MKTLLDSGVTLVVDRYAFSGVAFTGAKENFDLGWCKTPDIGLPAPDCVVYLTLNPNVAATRGDYGGERYEDTDFQCKVEKNFHKYIFHLYVMILSIRSSKTNLYNLHMRLAYCLRRKKPALYVAFRVHTKILKNI